nr:hypothetical protein [Anaerolineae bacterium]
MNRYRFILLIAFLAIAVAGCAPGDAGTPTPMPTATDLPIDLPAGTVTPEPTDTPEPTATLTEEPTATPTDVPTATQPPTATPTSTTPPVIASPTPVVSDYKPQARSVWQLGRYALSTSSTEACGGDYPFDFYGLVSITPDANGIVWMRAQDSIPYSLAQTNLNQFYGSGASALPGFTLNISVAFTGPQNLLVTYTLIPNDNTACQHTYNYDGVFNW